MKFKPSEDLANATQENVKAFITQELQTRYTRIYKELQDSPNEGRRTPINWDYLTDPDKNPDLK